MLLHPKNYAFTTYYISDSYTSTSICFSKTEISNTFCFLRCLGFVKKSINKNRQIYFSIFSYSSLLIFFTSLLSLGPMGIISTCERIIYCEL